VTCTSTSRPWICLGGTFNVAVSGGYLLLPTVTEEPMQDWFRRLRGGLPSALVHPLSIYWMETDSRPAGSADSCGLLTR